MKIVIAPDSFKGCLRSPAVAEAMAAGARRVFPAAVLALCPLGDGGEGTLDALLVSPGGSVATHAVSGPLGEPLQARLGLLADGETVYVELAEASGLSCLPPERRDARRTTSFGTGELLARAYETGRRRIIVGLGGSATNDGGAGLLGALGARFLDGDGQSLPPGGAALRDLRRIELGALRRPPEGVELVVATDVTNPFCGPEGASAIYGPQKGASPGEVRELDAALAHFAAVSAAVLGRDLRDHPGAGAAGGAGFALCAFLGGRVESGQRLVLDLVGLAPALRDADLALTGEGRIDHQTFNYGKTLAGIGARCREAGVPCVAFAGGLTGAIGDHAAAGIGAVCSVVPGPMSLEEALTGGAGMIAEGVERGLRLYSLAVEVGRRRRSASAREGAA